MFLFLLLAAHAISKGQQIDLSLLLPLAPKGLATISCEKLTVDTWCCEGQVELSPF